LFEHFELFNNVSQYKNESLNHKPSAKTTPATVPVNRIPTQCEFPALTYFYGMSSSIQIREIQPADNPMLARIVKDTLAEFGANRPGTVYYDSTTDHLFELFQKTRSVYYVALLNNEIVGGGGIYPTDALPEDTCELVKMYLLPHARGMNLGRTLIEKNIAYAESAGYKNIYLETMPELKQALSVYAKFGFEYLKGPMGNSGHTGCSLWMLKKM
jgi:putative acetyltransferase